MSLDGKKGADTASTTPPPSLLENMISEKSSATVAGKKASERNTYYETPTTTVPPSTPNKQECKKGSQQKRGCCRTPSDPNCESIEDRIRRSLGSPIKRRRRFRRRNSFVVHRQHAERWSNAVLRSLAEDGEEQGNGNDDGVVIDYADLHSLSDLFFRSNRTESPSDSSITNEPLPGEEREAVVASASNRDLHASWSTSDDSRGYNMMEFSLLSLAASSSSSSPPGLLLDATESTTSFTASSSSDFFAATTREEGDEEQKDIRFSSHDDGGYHKAAGTLPRG